MLKPTHRAFNFAAVSGLILGGMCLKPEWVQVSDLLTMSQQILLIQGGSVLAASWPDRLEIVHRGFSHSLWVVLILSGGTIALLTHPFLFALMSGITFGWFFHLFGDAFSTAGIAWFYPIQGYRRYESGAFCVKGHRGPFLPLYKVGDSAFSFMPKVWWVTGLLFSMGIWYRIGGLI